MSNTNELKEYLERKLRLGKLDSALLFFCSSLSIAFGIGYAYLGTKWFQYYFPMLLLGWFMPIHIGYVRGSLIKDSVEERIRGWLYFAIGLGNYISVPLLFGLIDTLQVKFPLNLLGLIPSSILVFLIGFRSKSIIVCEIFRIQTKNISREVNRAFSRTIDSAFFLSLSFNTIFAVEWSDLYSKPDLLINMLETVTIAFLVLNFAFIILAERDARKLLESIQK